MIGASSCSHLRPAKNGLQALKASRDVRARAAGLQGEEEQYAQSPAVSEAPVPEMTNREVLMENVIQRQRSNLDPRLAVRRRGVIGPC